MTVMVQWLVAVSDGYGSVMVGKILTLDYEKSTDPDPQSTS